MKTKLLTKSPKYETAIQQHEQTCDGTEKPPNYAQGRKCQSFKMMHKLVSNCSKAQLRALEQEIKEKTQYNDVLMFDKNDKGEWFTERQYSAAQREQLREYRERQSESEGGDCSIRGGRGERPVPPSRDLSLRPVAVRLTRTDRA